VCFYYRCSFFFLFDHRFNSSLLQKCLSLNGLISTCCVWNRHDCHEVLERALQWICRVSFTIIDYISFYKWQLCWILILFLRLWADLWVNRIGLWQSYGNKYALNDLGRRLRDCCKWLLVRPICTQHSWCVLLKRLAISYAIMSASYICNIKRRDIPWLPPLLKPAYKRKPVVDIGLGQRCRIKVS
jgi:hypothetical protein